MANVQDQSYAREEGNAELWETIFAKGHPDLCKQQRIHQRMPKEPRCRLCHVPFAGWGGWVMRRRGKRRSSRNQHYCNACDGFLDAFPGGAEVEMTMLFVDIRGSTAMAQANSPKTHSENVNRFLDVATDVVTDHDGFILAFYGDCIVAVWPPGFVGLNHANKAIHAASALVGHEALRDTSGDQIPVGVGVHTDGIFIGTVEAAKGLFRDVSVFGTGVNITARLAASAARSEALISERTAQMSGRDMNGFDFQTFDLKGIDNPVRATRIKAG